MVINNKLFKFSSLCIVGAVSFGVIRFSPSSAAKAGYNKEVEINNDENQSALFNSGDGDISTFSIDVLADAGYQKEISENVENAKDEQFSDHLPEIDGINKLAFDRKKYKNFAIAKCSEGESYILIKEQPNDSSATVGRLSVDGGCFVQESKDGWCKISSGKVVGYVPADKLITDFDEVTKIIMEKGLYYAIAKEDLKVREQADESCEELYTIAQGEAMIVKNVEGDWIKVISVISDKDEDCVYIPKDKVDIKFQMRQAQEESSSPLIGITTKRAKLVKTAKTQLNIPYSQSPGTLWNKALDCSGLVQNAYRRSLGIELPRTAHEQAWTAKSISEEELRVGDLVFYYEGNKNWATHVAIYLGDGMIIHAPTFGDVVKISKMKFTNKIFYGRVIDD